MTKEKLVTVCPRCNSADVSVDFSNKATFAYGLPPKYVCNGCGHLGEVFPEIPEENVPEFKKHKKHIVKEPKIDATSGYFAGRIEIVIFLSLVGFLLTILGFYVESFLAFIFGSIVLAITFFIYRKIKGH